MSKFKTELKMFSHEDNSLIFHAIGDKIVLDARIEYEIAMQRKLKQHDCSTYDELRQLRTMIKLKSRIGEDMKNHEHALSLALPTEQDIIESKTYIDFKDYLRKNNQIVKEDSI